MNAAQATAEPPKQFSKEWWDEQKALEAQQRTLAVNQILLADAGATAVQQRVDAAFLLAGKGHAPAPTAGQSRVDYERQAVAALKGIAGLNALETSTMSPGSMPHLLESVIEKVVGKPPTATDPGVEPCWKRPHDLKPGQSRTVLIPDQTGRELSTEVFGAGTVSPFKCFYGHLMTKPQILVDTAAGKPSLNG